MSNDEIRKNIGHATSYGYAKSTGRLPEGMDEDAYAELMADYVTVGQTAVAAKNAAVAAKDAAETAASTATTKAAEASQSATTATNAANAAQADADAAALDASQAMSAASTATTKASEASQSATTATNAKNDAVTAKTAAQAAQTAAETAEDNAETSASAAAASAASVAESAAQIQTNAEDISQLKSDLNQDIENGKNTFLVIGNFQRGGLNTDGSIKPQQHWRVSNDNPMAFFRDITISVKSGFRWGYIPFINESVGDWKGWYTSDVTIPAGTSFVVQIARVSEDIYEYADINEFVGSLTFDSIGYANSNNIELLNADVEAIKSASGDVVPTYFASNLSTKIPEIISNMDDAGQDGTTFVFITDLHWETNYKNSPALVKRVLDKTSVKNVFCGGDIINQGEKAEMAEVFLDCINRFRFVPNLGFFPIARGNHDDNSNWSSSADVAQYAFDDNTIYNLLYSQFADRVTRIGSNWTFYFDQEPTKTRYIFVDTKRNGLVIDCSAIINCLNTVNTNWHVVFLMHFTLLNATTLFDGCSLLGHVVNAYNNRQSGSYAGTYQTATYDFTNANGTVDLIIGGHMHADYAMNADDVNNPSGVPIIATDTDSYRDHSGTEGTVNSQCFDVVTVNYETKIVKCVRIGRGFDRTFMY